MTDIFINIATDDLERAKAYYTALGATLNSALTDDNAACVVWDDNIFFMVLTREFFASMTEKAIADPRTSTQVLIAMSRESREDVDAIIEKGLAAGGSTPGPAQDYGFMYSRDLEDPDGNGIQFMWMDPIAAEKGPEAFLAEQVSA